MGIRPYPHCHASGHACFQLDPVVRAAQRLLSWVNLGNFKI